MHSSREKLFESSAVHTDTDFWQKKIRTSFFMLEAIDLINELIFAETVVCASM